MLEIFLAARRKVSAAIKQWLGAVPIKSPNASGYSTNPIIPKTSSYTISGWINVTADQGVLFSLGTYYNISGTIYHAMLVFNSLALGYAPTFKFNSFQFVGFEVAPNSAFSLNQWFHVAAEMSAQPDGTFVLKVAKNGVFVYTKVLPAYHVGPAYPLGGGQVGICDPNSGSVPGTGTLYDVQVQDGLVWKGVNFTPPARRV